MINKLHAQIYRPEKGWDPINKDYAYKYAEDEWKKGVDEDLIKKLEEWLGGFKNKSIIDLGGGPGHYSIAFAKRGAEVTWYDISANYRAICMEKASQAGVNIKFVLGYMDEAPKILNNQYDLVFNRVCWYYGFSDFSFGKILFSLVKPGGVGYIDSNNSLFQREQLSKLARFRTWLNDVFGIKIGHPYPPHNRIAKILLKFDIEKILIDYSKTTNDRIIFIRRKDK